MKLYSYIVAIMSLTLSASAFGDTTGTLAQGNIALLYSNTTTVAITALSRTDSTCALTFRLAQPQGSSFSISPQMYLSDEQGGRHPLLRAEGVEIGKKEYVTEPSGQLFTLMFEALPKSTRYFDLIEGDGEAEWRIYGIHDKQDERSFPSVNIGKNELELSQEFFTTAPITIKGRFTDYQRRGMPHIVRFNYSYENYDWTDVSAYPFCCMVQADGTFEYQFNYNRPVWADMSFDQNNRKVGFYVRPGDVLEVTLSNLGKEDEEVAYHNASGRATCDGLMNLMTFDVPWNNPTRQATYVEPSVYRHIVDSVSLSAERGMDYLAWKWQLTPWETHLLKTKRRLELLSMYSQYINAYIDNKSRPHYEEGQSTTHYISEEDAAYLNELIDWTDPSSVITQEWYGANNWLLARTEVVKKMHDYMGSGKGDRDGFLNSGFGSAVRKLLPDIAPILLADLIDNERGREHAYGNSFAFQAKDPVADKLLKRLAEAAESQYVQVVLLDPRGAGYSQGISGQTHWMADFHEDPTMSFVFVISDAMTDKDQEALAFWFHDEKLMIASEEEFIHLQAALRITTTSGEGTITKEGQILTYQLHSDSEQSFRNGLRSLRRLESKIATD